MPAMPVTTSVEPNGVFVILFKHHQPDGRRKAAAFNDVQAGIEDDRFDAVAFEEGARDLRFDELAEPAQLDEPAHHGTTSPATISSGRGARPRIALRCGKRPNRSMMS